MGCEFQEATVPGLLLKPGVLPWPLSSVSAWPEGTELLHQVSSRAQPDQHPHQSKHRCFLYSPRHLETKSLNYVGSS